MKNKLKVIFMFILLIATALFYRDSFSFRVMESNKYVEAVNSIIPDNYELNTELSKCSSGTLSWDKLSDSITYKTNAPAKCYWYLDKTDDEVYYSSLKQAVDAINSDVYETSCETQNAFVSVDKESGMIKLLRDVTLDESIQILKDTFINLNGHTIKLSSDSYKNAFINVASGVTLELYGRKNKSRVEFVSDNNTPAFSLGDKSTLKITGGDVSLDYSGKENYSLITTESENKTSNIFISDADFDINGSNISFFYSTKVLSMSLLNTELTIKGDNISLIDSFSKDTKVDLDSLNIIYDLKDSRDAHLINVPLGKLEIKNTNMVLMDESKENKNSKIIAKDLLLDSSSMTCKINSSISIIEIENSSEINNLNMTCTSDQIYNGINLVEGKLTIYLSVLNLDGPSTGIKVNNGNVDIKDTTINAKTKIQKDYLEATKRSN